ncbi:MAG TPA: hypothetical protein PLN85_03915 [archaeon]|jgi:hypothetical protein|nr:hypothetical protein [archaeon]
MYNINFNIKFEIPKLELYDIVFRAIYQFKEKHKYIIRLSNDNNKYPLNLMVFGLLYYNDNLFFYLEDVYDFSINRANIFDGIYEYCLINKITTYEDFKNLTSKDDNIDSIVEYSQNKV